MRTRKYTTALIGAKFNRWTVIGYNKCYLKRLCRCECGTEKAVNASSLVRGESTSCGCYLRALLSNQFRTHGSSGTKAYNAWSAMRGRCNNPNNPNFHHYGGRGIKICERWERFENFLADMSEPPSTKHSIDRMNNDGNYEPSNCRWATQKQQSRNKRLTTFVEYQGQQRPLSEWCEMLGIPFTRTDSRLARGWAVSDAFEKPYRKRTVDPLGGSVNSRKRVYA